MAVLANLALLVNVEPKSFMIGVAAQLVGVGFWLAWRGTGPTEEELEEGRLDREQVDNFRRELQPEGGLSSYPHPWLMPDFWQVPSVSMGLAPVMAVLAEHQLRKEERAAVAVPGIAGHAAPEGLGAVAGRQPDAAGMPAEEGAAA